GCGQFGVIKQLDQRGNVIAAQHGAQQLGGLLAVDEGAGGLAEGNGGQKRGLDLGGVVDAGGHAVSDQFDQSGLFVGGRRLEQLDEIGGLLCRQGKGRNAQRSAFGNVLAVCFQHEACLFIGKIE